MTIKQAIKIIVKEKGDNLIDGDMIKTVLNEVSKWDDNLIEKSDFNLAISRLYKELNT